ncbi:MAG: GNAT family N-acetyltransferase [Candidatus Kerfeldbacteria bacterium]|nr:GNAT family N-acetyltransferase [Candidatus Kerfeldbacteria bacterium]
MPILRGKHLNLRPMRANDAAAFAVQANDREISRNTISVRYPYQLKDAQSFIQKTKKYWRERPLVHTVFGIEVDGKIVGCIGLHKIVPGHKAEIGYWLGRSYRGRGLMTEAVRLVVRYAWRLRLHRVYAFTFLWNTGSQRVLTKAGFRHEGILRKNVKKNGRALDDHIFSIVR